MSGLFGFIIMGRGGLGPVPIIMFCPINSFPAVHPSSGDDEDDSSDEAVAYVCPLGDEVGNFPSSSSLEDVQENPSLACVPVSSADEDLEPSAAYRQLTSSDEAVYPSSCSWDEASIHQHRA